MQATHVTLRHTAYDIRDAHARLHMHISLPYFLEISPHLELSPPSKSRRVVLTLDALNAALEFSPHVVKGRHYYSAHTYVILTLILNNAQCARAPIVLLVLQ